MQYTSEQYKYKLLRLMQRNFHMTDDTDRRYTLAFFGKLFDGVTVTEESYNGFVDQMRIEMDYCRKNNIYACENLPDDVINEHGLILAESFAKIGIDLVIDTETDTATFTKPDGSVMVYQVYSDMTMRNYFYINAGYGLESSYGKASAPYFTLENMKMIGLDEYETRLAGDGTTWDYDEMEKTMHIKGSGSFISVTDEEQVIGGTYDTIIIGSGVNKINSSAIYASLVKKVIFLHPSDAEITLPSNSNGISTLFSYSSSNTYTIDIYADNEIVKAITLPTAITATWHSLDEWEG